MCKQEQTKCLAVGNSETTNEKPQINIMSAKYHQEGHHCAVSNFNRKPGWSREMLAKRKDIWGWKLTDIESASENMLCQQLPISYTESQTPGDSFERRLWELFLIHVLTELSSLFSYQLKYSLQLV